MNYEWMRRIAAEYEAARRRLQPQIEAVERVIQQHGPRLEKTIREYGPQIEAAMRLLQEQGISPARFAELAQWHTAARKFLDAHPDVERQLRAEWERREQEAAEAQQEENFFAWLADQLDGVDLDPGGPREAGK